MKVMKAYQDNGYKYFYDTNIQLWTIFEIDDEGHQIGDSDYYPNRSMLKKQYPEIEFIPYNK